MILLRAMCDCGFFTRKARAGVLHGPWWQWWFPVYSTSNGALTDIHVSLPEAKRELIKQHDFELHLKTPRDDKQARRQAGMVMGAFHRKVHDDYLDQETCILQSRFASENDCVFNPAIGTQLSCPACKRASLAITQVQVTAFCSADCGNVYQWLNSEASGCPRCGSSPHRFQTDCDIRFANHERTICHCSCFTSTEAASHIDGFCPKCGQLPEHYQHGGKDYCGLHHAPMLPFAFPCNIFLREPAARWVAHRFPNAKIWGDAKTGEESVPGMYCQLCESDHQLWLHTEDNHDD